MLGLPSVSIVFTDGTDLLRARHSRRNGCLRSKDAGAAVPNSSLSRVRKIGWSSKTLPQTEMSELAVRTIRLRLMAVPGVANVAVRGRRDKHYQVLVDPGRRCEAQGDCAREFRCGDAGSGRVCGHAESASAGASTREHHDYRLGTSILLNSILLPALASKWGGFAKVAPDDGLQRSSWMANAFGVISTVDEIGTCAETPRSSFTKKISSPAKWNGHRNLTSRPLKTICPALSE